ADAVTGITQGTRYPLHVRILRTGEARAHQAVEATRVEVAPQPLPKVPHMLPLAGDARRVWRERRRRSDRRTHLTTMRGLERWARTGVGCARARSAGIAAGGTRTARVHGPATGHPAAIQRSGRASPPPWLPYVGPPSACATCAPPHKWWRGERQE